MPAISMKTMTVHSMKAESNAATLAFRGAKPPMDTVVSA